MGAQDIDPNELSAEITPQEEQTLINETLGIDTPLPEETPAEELPDENPEENPEEPNEEPEEPQAPEEPSVDEEPEEFTPPEVQTDDLWIEVDKVTTDDDGNAKTEKVKLTFDPNDPDSFVPDDFTFKSDKQLSQILEAKQEMKNLHSSRLAERDKAIEENEKKTTESSAKEEQLKGWDNEIQTMIDSGLLEAPKAKPEDKEFKEDPTVQKVDATLKFMGAENKKRSEEGKPTITSFGVAFAMREKQEAEAAQAEEEKKKAEDTKKKGALVGGSSASSGGETKAYKPGSYGSIWDVPVDLD